MDDFELAESHVNFSLWIQKNHLRILISQEFVKIKNYPSWYAWKFPCCCVLSVLNIVFFDFCDFDKECIGSGISQTNKQGQGWGELTKRVSKVTIWYKWEVFKVLFHVTPLIIPLRACFIWWKHKTMIILGPTCYVAWHIFFKLILIVTIWVVSRTLGQLEIWDIAYILYILKTLDT